MVVAGCGDKKTPNTTANVEKPSTNVAANPAALNVEGPNGVVAIGDDLTKAKKAFPAPNGAHVFDKSMNFAILGGDGWAWMNVSQLNGFEVALKDGKIIGFALTELGSKPEPDAAEKEAAKLGPPTRKAIGKTASAYVWESGDSARVLLLLHKETALLGTGKMTLIGAKKDLAMLNYRAEDQETIVRIMDAGAEQFEQLEKSQKK